MTQIHISIRKPRTGGLDPVTGTMRFRPVRRHFDAEKNLVIAASFDANLSETGELTVDLLPTTSAFVWQVIELADTPQAYTRYVEVPDSRTKVEYADLVEVDAGTFVPKDMAGSQLLKVRHASTQSEAETLSAQYPDELVFFDETATTAKAAAALSTLESITAEAQTNAMLAKSAMLSARSSADSATATQSDLSSLASNASMAAASVANDSQTVADTASMVAAKGETASPPSIRRCGRSRTRRRLRPPYCLPPAPPKAPPTPAPPRKPRRNPARTPRQPRPRRPP